MQAMFEDNVLTSSPSLRYVNLRLKVTQMFTAPTYRKRHAQVLGAAIVDIVLAVVHAYLGVELPL